MMCVPADRRPITARRFPALSAAPARTPLEQGSPSRRDYAGWFGGGCAPSKPPPLSKSVWWTTGGLPQRLCRVVWRGLCPLQASPTQQISVVDHWLILFSRDLWYLLRALMEQLDEEEAMTVTPDRQ